MALSLCTHMLMIVPKLIDPLSDWRYSGRGYVGDDQAGPFRHTGHELQI